MVKEIWKDVPGCEGRYFVSNLGRIKGPKKILSPIISNWGYGRVRIVDNSGKRISPRIHRLVAQVFLPNPEYKPQVDHKDGNKLDNSVNNLEWTTASENKQRSIDKLGVQPWGLPVHRIRCIESEQEYCSVSFASKQTGVSKTQLREHLLGRRAHAGGLHWEYTK